MSASETNIEKRATNHKRPLIDLKGVLVCAAILLAGLLILTVSGVGRANTEQWQANAVSATNDAAREATSN